MNRPDSNELAGINDIVEALRTGNDQLAGVLYNEFAGKHPPPQQSFSHKQKNIGHANGRIGIWKLHTENGQSVYQRDPEYRNEWRYWADVESFTIKKNAKQVIYVGESVARGYLYDPTYNPVMIMQHLLNTYAADDEYQILDLARVSAKFSGLMQTIGEAAGLQPDYLVVFAGNNWDILSMSVDNPELQQAIIDFMAAGNLKGLEELTANVFKNATQKLFQSLKNSYPGTEVIIVIPEINLADWQSSADDRILARMETGKMRRWLLVSDLAETACHNNNLASLLPLGSELIELDKTNPLGYEVLGRYEIAQGNHEQARRLLEQAKDMTLFGRNDTCRPRCLEITKQILRSESQQHGFTCIDVPELFRKKTGGSLPGSELFIDYCHLSAEGMKLVCSEIAAVVIRSLYGQVVTPEGLYGLCPSPNKFTSAYAHFLAAAHNAHFGQPSAILAYHLGKSLEYDMAISTVMILYAKLCSMRASSSLCQEFRALQANRTKRFQLLHPGNKKILDTVLVDAIVSALEKKNIPAAVEIEQLRLQQHGIQYRPVNLLLSYYSLFNYYHDENHELPYCRSKFRRSEFLFVTEPDADMLIKITMRRNGDNGATDRVAIEVNSKPVDEWEISHNWKEYSCRIDQRFLKRGINRIKIIWPLPCKSSRQEITTVRSYADWWTLIFYSNFGEIHSLYIQKALKSSMQRDDIAATLANIK